MVSAPNGAMAGNAYGVSIIGAHNTLGGTGPADANYIDGSGGDGIRLNADADNNTILGNVIGRVRTLGGSGNLANGIHLINASRNTIGAPGAGNVVSHDRLDGILTTSSSIDITRMDLDRSTLSATLYFGRTLPDGNYRLTAIGPNISDNAGNMLDGNGDGAAGDDFTYDFYVFAGDANRDRHVDFNDLVVLAQHYNTGLPALPVAAAAPATIQRFARESPIRSILATPRFSTRMIVPVLPTKPLTAPQPLARTRTHK